MAIEVRLEGVDTLLAKLGKLTPGARRVVRRNVRRTAVRIESRAKEWAPHSALQPPIKRPPSRSKGRLRSSIRHEVAPGGMAARIGTNVHYAPYQEFGTVHIPPRPFLGPAFQEHRGRFIADLVAELNQENRKASRR